MLLGKLVKPSSCTDLACQIYDPGEVETPPSSSDYGFATFVRITLNGTSASLISFVCDTTSFIPALAALDRVFLPRRT